MRDFSLKNTYTIHLYRLMNCKVCTILEITIWKCHLSNFFNFLFYFKFISFNHFFICFPTSWPVSMLLHTVYMYCILYLTCEFHPRLIYKDWNHGKHSHSQYIRKYVYLTLERLVHTASYMLIQGEHCFQAALHKAAITTVKPVW